MQMLLLTVALLSSLKSALEIKNTNDIQNKLVTGISARLDLTDCAIVV